MTRTIVAAVSAMAIGLLLTSAALADDGLADAGLADAGAKAERPAEQDWHVVPTHDAKLWKSVNFGGEGEVTLGDEAIRMGFGDPLTGVRCLAEIPRENYEIELESRRLSNFDFFCGLTFPVGKDHCSLILGGWAGAVVGLSSVDGEDASSNPTKRLMHFDNDRWYRVRVRVTDDKIECWIDDKAVVVQPRKGHTFDIRVEMHPSLPVGVAAYQCEAELRNFRWRRCEAPQ